MDLIFSGVSEVFQPPRLQQIPLAAITREANFASGGCCRTINETFVDDLDHKVVWQPDVYSEAFELARRLHIENVIDLGCGSGDKLVHCSNKYNIRTLGLDFNGSIDVARRKHPEYQWGSIDLMACDIADPLFDELKSRLPAVIILSDVIEHLPDVQPALSLIRKLLQLDENSYLIVSTPDRARQNRDSVDALSPNSAHVREWTLPELCQLVSGAGFEISRAGWTRCNQWDEFHTTSFLQAGFSFERYKKRLQRTFGFSSEWWPEHVLITSEVHGATASGGVGSFIIEQQANYGPEKVIILVATDGEVKLVERPYGALTPEDILPNSNISKMPLEDRVLRAVEQLIFMFPGVVSVQSQEYQGISCRIAQAKRSGILNSDVSIVVHCHGNTHYLENGKKDWYGLSHMISSVKEKISVECADVVCFPSKFLRDLYCEAGIDLSRQKVEMRRYPYAAEFDTNSPMAPIDTLVFFGKRTLMKGFGLFLESIEADRGISIAELGVKNIVIIGGAQSETSDFDFHIEELKGRFDVVVYGNYARSDAISCLRELAPRALVVMPYLGDNYPFSVYDAMSANALPIVVAAGGVPEMLPIEFTSRLVSNPDAGSLNKTIERLLGESPEDISKLRCDLARVSNERQAQINIEASAPFEKDGRAQVSELPSVSVIIPFFNTPILQVEELLWSLAQQIYLPQEIIIVDDASTEEAQVGLDELISRFSLRFASVVLVRHEVNRGLAGARNTALSKVSGELTICIDSDDVALNTFISDIAQSFRLNPDVDAFVPYLEAFDDGADFKAGVLNGYVYRPLGDGVIASQTDNILGHANSGFRTSALKSLGGWDQTSRAMWEDYALYMRLVSSGRRIGVIPRTGVFYRVTPKSMARTYSRWPAMRLVALNTVGLPRFEAFRLQAALRELTTLHNSVAHSAQEHARLCQALNDANQRLNSPPSSDSLETHIAEAGEPPERAQLAAREIELDDLKRRCQALAQWAVSPAERRLIAERRLQAMASVNGKSRRSFIGEFIKRTLRPKHERTRRLVLASGFFDPKWYLEHYPDLGHVDLLDHYLMHGGSEGRAPGPSFNSATYMRLYPDVADSRLNPLVHYLRFGALEGRQTGM